MDFVNVGGNNTGSAVPMACMCSSGSGFTNARGDDGCFHCGCSCKQGANTNAGNASRAKYTIRKSGTWE